MFRDITRDDVYRIETQRLWLRWPKLTDAPAIATALADRRISDMTSRIPHPYPDGHAEEFIYSTRESNHDGTALGLVITPKQKPNSVIGAISLTSVDDNPKQLVLGYWIAATQWEKGFGSEAALSMVQTGFSLSKAESIDATVKPENTASKRILAKIGFQETGRESRFMPARQREEVIDCFRLTRVDWRNGGAWSGFGAAA
jgi:RimJ/RimL family protein N-acetyltransferase